jgi:hypothetical protein
MPGTLADQAGQFLGGILKSCSCQIYTCETCNLSRTYLFTRTHAKLQWQHSNEAALLSNCVPAKHKHVKCRITQAGEAQAPPPIKPNIYIYICEDVVVLVIWQNSLHDEEPNVFSLISTFESSQ